jgi:hypothetical protein
LNPNLNRKQLVDWFEETYKQRIDVTSVTRILSDHYDSVDSTSSEALQKHTKRRREKWPELEAALIEWKRRAEKQIIVSRGYSCQGQGILAGNLPRRRYA